MIVIADINTIWRRKPFTALAEFAPVLGALPQDPVLALRKRNKHSIHSIKKSGRLNELTVTLPPSWASRTALIAQSYLWRRLLLASARLGSEIIALVVTSPHYLSMVRKAKKKGVPVFYYASDDYVSYQGWGGTKMADRERALMDHVDHSFFVSHALACRARREYKIDSKQIAVSMNATEKSFFFEETELTTCRESSGKLKPPIVGVIGGINERLDFELMKRVADLNEVGTLLCVGPVDGALNDNPAFAALKTHPKSIFPGPQTHDEIPRWMRLLDVAIIPYRCTQMNYYCSPMRLFDHMASGVSIVATDACDQMGKFLNWIDVAAQQDEFLDMVVLRTKGQRKVSRNEQIKYARQQHVWSVRAKNLSEFFNITE